MKKFIFATLLASIAAPALAWQGGDASYNFSTSGSMDSDAPAHSFVDISGTGVLLLPLSEQDDGVTTLDAALGAFSFSFYGVTYTSADIGVSSNGGIVFASTVSLCCRAITPPDSSRPPAILVVQEDLDPAGGNAGDIFAQMIGNEVIVQWHHSEFWRSGGDVTAQVRMNLLNGAIVVSHHTPMDTDGNTISVGLNAGDGVGGILPHRSAVPPTNTSYLMAPVSIGCEGGIDAALCASTEWATTEGNVAYGSTIIRESAGKARFRPSNIYGRMETIRGIGLAAGCDPTASTWAGAYGPGGGMIAADGTTTGGGIVAGVVSGGRHVAGTVDASSYADVYEKVTKNGKALFNNGAGVVAGHFLRTKGKRGLWYALEGDCAMGDTLYTPWLGSAPFPAP